MPDKNWMLSDNDKGSYGSTTLSGHLRRQVWHSVQDKKMSNLMYQLHIKLTNSNVDTKTSKVQRCLKRAMQQFKGANGIQIKGPQFKDFKRPHSSKVFKGPAVQRLTSITND